MLENGFSVFLTPKALCKPTQPNSEPCANKYFSLRATNKNTVLTVIITAVIIYRQSLFSKTESLINNSVS